MIGLVAVLCAGALLAAAPGIDLLTVAPASGGLPHGWRLRPVRGCTPPDLESASTGGRTVWRIHGAGRAAWFYREQSAADGLLVWSWRVLEAPDRSDLRVAAADDSPIRVYVVFGSPGPFGSDARILFYSFGNAEPDGWEGESHANRSAYILRRDGASERGRWCEHEARPYDDYRRIWRRQPPAVTAIGVMQDTDQTAGRALAELRRLEWIAGEAGR